MKKGKVIKGFVKENEDFEDDMDDKENSEGLDKLEIKWQKRIDMMILDFLGETEHDLAGETR